MVFFGTISSFSPLLIPDGFFCMVIAMIFLLFVSAKSAGITPNLGWMPALSASTPNLEWIPLVKELTAKVNGQVLRWLKKIPKSRPINIIELDFYRPSFTKIFLNQ